MPDRPIRVALAALRGVKRLGDGWVALCPAHDDGAPSLKVDEGTDGRVLLHCHAGCQPKAIVQAMGLRMRDLMAGDTPLPPRSSPTPLRVVGNTVQKVEPDAPPKHTWPETARYDYTDEDGAVLFSVVRRELDGRKTFTQIQPDGTHGLKGVTARPLYRLPLVRHAVATGEVVVIVEGEKDVDTAEALGYCATTNLGGANSWNAAHHVAPLTNANVVVIPDNDAPGREWAQKVCTDLLGVAAMVRVVMLPGVPDKGDLTDWVNAGGTLEALSGLILRAPKYTGGELPENPNVPSKFRVYTAEELAELPPVQWLVQDVVPSDALVALVGPSGVGKTFVSLDLACSVAVGTPWLGHRMGTAAPVLYIAAEGTAGLRTRLTAWAESHGLALGALPLGFICETVNLMDPDDPTHVIRAMTRMPVPPGCVVIDTLHRAMPGGDENSAKDVGIVVAAADRIRRVAGCTVVLVHHTKKDADVERGSTALRAACDTLMLLKDEDGTLSLECEKQKDAAAFDPVAIHLTPAHGSLVVSLADGAHAGGPVADPARLTPKQYTCLKALADSSTAQGMAATPWHRCAGVPERTFFRAVKALVDAGLVAEADRSGRYSVTMTGRSALSFTAKTTANVPAISLPNGGSGMAVTAQKPRGDIAPLKGGVYHPPVGSLNSNGRANGSGSNSVHPSRRSAGRSDADAPPAWVLDGPPDDGPEPWWHR
jgi:hypothetical protein